MGGGCVIEYMADFGGKILGWSVSTRTRGRVFGQLIVDGQDGGHDVWQHAIGRSGRRLCGRGVRTGFLRDAEGFAVGVSGKDPNSRDDGNAVTAVTVVGHKAQRGRTAGATRAQTRSRGGGGSSRRRDGVVDVVDDEDEATEMN